MDKFRTIDDLEVRGRRVLVRADLNLPVRDGQLTDTTRLDRLAPTLLELAEGGARVVVLSHFDRPGGRVRAAMSLGQVVGALSRALGGRPVAFAPHCIGPLARATVDALADGEIALLENLRFHPGEEANDPAFAAALAALGELYVNDAFSTAHRAHASTEALARLLPAAAGRLMAAELGHLHRALDAPARPVAAIVGGAKISTKLELVGNLLAKVEYLAIGGGMANTFLYARGIAVGRSLCEREMADAARDIDAIAARDGREVILPVDAVVAARLEAGTAHRTVAIEQVPPAGMVLDVGPATVRRLAKLLADSRTLIWNGPLGAFEVPPFDAGTTAAAHEAARLTRQGRLVSVAGGGDTVAALVRAGVVDDFSYVSTAGGAFLEWLEGRTLPALAALEEGAR